MSLSLSLRGFTKHQWRQRQIDATRIADGKQVYIKLIPTHGEELRICQMFSEDSRRGDPKNHAVPILDVFQDDEESTMSYMVMPLLRDVDAPPFEFVADVVDFVDQLLEVCGQRNALALADLAQGLVYLHESGVAHRYAVLA